jgi:NAD(P)-dependent dehydrogenase (short-subunit alcohol dehydrogenase family)
VRIVPEKLQNNGGALTVSATEQFQSQITPTPSRLEGRIALITGGANGIGWAIVRRFAQEGAHVAIADVSTESGMAAERRIRAQGGQCIFRRTDVSDRSSVEAAVQAVIDEFGAIDILVNNAGIIRFGSLMDCTAEDWKRMLAVDLEGAFYCTQIVGRYLRQANRPGRLIHVGSTASLFPAPQQGAYSVAKAGLRMISRMAAMELGRYGITSNLLCPEGAVTDMNRELLKDPEMMQKIEAAIPLGRLSTTDEIAAAAAFLASDEAAFITGAELVHDGGITISSLWWR